MRGTHFVGKEIRVEFGSSSMRGVVKSLTGDPGWVQMELSNWDNEVSQRYVNLGRAQFIEVINGEDSK